MYLSFNCDLDIFGIQNIFVWIRFESGYLDIKLLDLFEYLIQFVFSITFKSSSVWFFRSKYFCTYLLSVHNIKQNKINVEHILQAYLTYIIIGPYFKNAIKNGLASCQYCWACCKFTQSIINNVYFLINIFGKYNKNTIQSSEKCQSCMKNNVISLVGT